MHSLFAANLVARLTFNHGITGRMENSVDPDQLASSADQDLH